jgi:methylase of polypeptide subunit release factors
MNPTRTLFGLLARSPRVAARLFGGVFPSLRAGERYFDATTLALRNRLKGTLVPGERVLEVGTGSHATLARWLHARLGCEVLCTELDPASAQRARARLARERLKLEVRCGELFADVDEPLDWVVFNPPYVPTAVGQARGLSERQRSTWDGGPDGTSVLEAFLAAFEARETRARAFLGINARYLRRARVEELVAAHPGLVLAGVRHQKWLAVDVYELQRS